ncbi:MAG: dephospho-CoA kinase [Rhodospirillales bacterium]|jgi:dephospho-CoA kinase
MIILGLTGSIAMGKTTAANMFRRIGIPVHDADAKVHALLNIGGKGVEHVAKAFPETIVKTSAGVSIDRTILGRSVFKRPSELVILEAILHPLVRKLELQFLRQAALRREVLVVLDVPLLFETGGAERCDLVAVVSAPAFVQRQRALARRNMTLDRFSSILVRQMPDGEKRRLADNIIPTGLGYAYSFAVIQRIVGSSLSRPVQKWRPNR